MRWRGTSRISMLEQVVEAAPLHWKELPRPYQTDKQFVLAVLHKAEVLPSKSDFERTFPQSLRFDKDIVLAFCQRTDFEELYKSRHLYIPASLVDDKDVLLAYCAKIPRALQEASERLIDDKEVVSVAVQRDGRELQYASWRLQGSMDILQLAVSNHGHAFLSCPQGPTRDALLNNRDFIKTVLSNQGGTLYRELTSPTLRHDPELIVLALHNGLSLRHIPESFRNDPTFLCRIVSQLSRLFLDIAPKTCDLAVAALGAPDLSAELVHFILHKVPRIWRVCHKHVALAICKYCETTELELYLERHSLYWNDKEIMRNALQKSPTLFRRLSTALQHDPELIAVAIQPDTCLNVLRSVHGTVLCANPTLCVRAVAVHQKGSERQLLVHLIPDTLWLNCLDLQVGWMRKYGVLDKFVSRLGHEELALKVAEVCQHEFPKVHESLRNDLDFMKRAVNISGRVIRYAGRNIQNDPMLQVIAVANQAWSISNEQRQGLATFINTKLALRDTFHLVLCGIHSDSSHLSVLNIDTETSLELKQRLASNLGVPLAADFKLLQKAKHNVEHPPPYTREDDMTWGDRDRLWLHRRRGLRLRFLRRDRRDPQQQEEEEDLEVRFLRRDWRGRHQHEEEEDLDDLFNLAF